ncbi:MAG: hypothetical protein PVH29_14970, partial [Candidatus Zixiibacteriota bacterium]
ADEFNQNYEDICDAVGARYIRGTACVDKNSTSTTCEIWLAADGGERDVCDDGWYALIYYGASNVWETTVAVSGSDCYIVFTDSELKNPVASGISDYSAAPFIDDLHVLLFPTKMKLPADWLITTDEADGALSAADIYHDGGTLADYVDGVKDRIDVALDTTGFLNAGIVDSDAIAGESAVMSDSAVNLLAGGSLEHYGDQHNLLFRVEITEDSSAQEYEIVSASEHTDGSACAQRVQAGGSNEGILLDLSPNFADGILAGKDVAASFRVKTSVENSLEIGFLEDDTTYSGTTPAIAADEWTTITVTQQIGPSTSEVKAYVRSNTGPVEFYVARAQVNLGDKCFGFSISPYEDAARILMDTTQDNLFYNGGFERWALGDSSAQPDGWFAEGAATLSATYGSSDVAPGNGYRICHAVLDANAAFGQYLGIITDSSCAETCANENILVGLVRGSKVCASVDLIMEQTSSAPVTLVLGDYDGTDSPDETTVVVEPLTTEMRRFSIYKEIREEARQVYFKILNDEAAQLDIRVDNAMLHVGEFPLKFKPSSGWREMRWDFSDFDLADSTSMEAMNITGGRYQMPGAAGGYLMLKAAASCLTPPSPDPNEFRLCVDDTTANGIKVEISDGETSGANHVTNYEETVHECTSYIQAPVSTGGGGDGDAGDVIMSVRGYYYAS